MQVDPALLQEWEARLAAEGLAPLGFGAQHLRPIRPYDPPAGLGDWCLHSPDPGRQKKARREILRLAARMPPYLGVVFYLRGIGQIEEEIAGKVGIDQTSVSWRWRKARRLAEIMARHPLLRDLAALDARLRRVPGLTPEQRQAILLRAGHWTIADAARGLGTPWATVQSRWARGLRWVLRCGDQELIAAIQALSTVHRRSPIMEIDPALLAEWEAKLAAEGLGPVSPLTIISHADHRAASALSAGYLSPPDPGKQRAARQEIERLARRMPPHLGEVLRLWGVGQTQTQIASGLGISQPSVAQRLHTARKFAKALQAHPLLLDPESLRSRVLTISSVPAWVADAIKVKAQTWSWTAAVKSVRRDAGTVRQAVRRLIREARAARDIELAEAIEALRRVCRSPTRR